MCKTLCEVSLNRTLNGQIYIFLVLYATGNSWVGIEYI